MIGDVTTFISNRAAELAAVMDKAGHPECDISWWISLTKRFRVCNDYRNKCAHPGEVFRWDELEELIAQLFKGSEENGVRVPGLLMDRTFRDAMEGSLVKDSDADTKSFVREAREELYQMSTVRYCPVYCKIRVCPADRNSLVQECIPVKKKDGSDRKLNMLHCRKCGRKFINMKALSVTIHLEDYYLEAMKSEDW